MPELPEVEAMARAVRPLVEGRRIRRCRVLRARAGRRALERNVTGATVQRVERRGKYLLLRLDRGCLALHFRLDGKLIWFAGAPARNADVALEFARGTLGFTDPRHLSRAAWAASPEAIPGIARLGPDPLAPGFTAERLVALLGRSRRPVKLWLMDQSRLSGLGNIYASEALWRAGISPRRRARRLRREEVNRLQQAIVAVLRAALKCTVHPAPALAQPGWRFASLERLLRVYGRKGRPCQRCGRAIRRIVQGGRGSYFCPGCQR